MKIKKDWWFANSIIYLITGVLGGFLHVINKDFLLVEKLVGTFLISGVEFLIGIALFKRSKLIFWIIFVLIIFQSLGLISQISNGLITIYSPKVFSAFIKLTFAIMLWQQIKREKKKK